MKRLIKWLLFTMTLCFFSAAFVACGETQGKKPKKESFDLYMIEYTDYQTYKEYKDVNDRRWENYVNTRSYSFFAQVYLAPPCFLRISFDRIGSALATS